jgi:hypothetical protein
MLFIALHVCTGALEFGGMGARNDAAQAPGSDAESFWRNHQSLSNMPSERKPLLYCVKLRKSAFHSLPARKLASKAIALMLTLNGPARDDEVPT